MQAWLLLSIALMAALVATFADGQTTVTAPRGLFLKQRIGDSLRGEGFRGALEREGFLERRCGPNEVYLQCGTACPRVCGRPPPQFCTYQCVSGCFCSRGFIRASYGNCIPEGQCYYRG